MTDKTKDQLLSIKHFIVAFILMTKGYMKIEHHHDVIGWTILLFGFIVLAYFVYTKFSNEDHTKLELLIHSFESIALFLTAYVYLEEGRHFLPYVAALAAIGFLIAVIMHLLKHQKHNPKAL